MNHDRGAVYGQRDLLEASVTSGRLGEGRDRERAPVRLGPDDPVRFSWNQSYGPISWPRDGNEVMRVYSTEPLYWKAPA